MESKPNLQSQSPSRRKTRRDVVLWDHIAMNEESRTIQGTFAHGIVERSKDRQLRLIWTSHKGKTGSRGFARITTCQATVSRSEILVAGEDKGRRTFSSLEEDGRRKTHTRQRTRTRSGGSGEANHNIHPEVPGRRAFGSGFFLPHNCAVRGV